VFDDLYGFGGDDGDSGHSLLSDQTLALARLSGN